MTHQPVSAIPGPQGPEMLRGIGLMRRNPPGFLAQCQQRYGPVVSFPIPRRTVLFVSDPQDVRRVLQGNHPAYGKRTIQYDTLALVTGHGLLASDGELWRRMRRIQQPAFHATLIEGMARTVQQSVTEWVTRWRALPEGTEIDLDQEMLQLTLEIVGGTLFGADLRAESAPLVSAVMSALHVVVAKSQQPVPVPGWLPTSGNRRLRESLVELDGAVSRLIRARRASPLGDDVLSLLLSALDDGTATSTEVRNEVVTLIVAGHETVASTLTWTWFLLATNPEVGALVRHEASTLPDTWDAGVPARLPVTRASIDECLRLYPPAWVISRKSIEADVLGGYEVPAGATIITSPYLLHRDGRLWPRPLRFDPNRFLAGAAPIDRTAYLPFGAGPRLCIGRDLALFEAPLVIAGLAQHFEVWPVPAIEPRLDFGVTLRPLGGLPAVLRGASVAEDAQALTDAP